MLEQTFGREAGRLHFFAAKAGSQWIAMGVGRPNVNVGVDGARRGVGQVGLGRGIRLGGKSEIRL